jgi:hypothetical protein
MNTTSTIPTSEPKTRLNLVLTASPILDPKVNAVLARLQAARSRPSNGGPRGQGENDCDPRLYAEHGFSIHPDQGNFIYLLCRAQRATRGAGSQRSNVSMCVDEHARGCGFRADESEFARVSAVGKAAFALAQQDRVALKSKA